ncbi:U24-ctenitoxin-Pn1a-like isoform X2 [Argiope bruennichi]|nr:U24-ctenitoxin-Pn1a-like isoform X2 [Argiope bruennichi]
MTKILTCAVLFCVSPVVLCFYRYPGRPGYDCPTAREKMLKNSSGNWMIPKCNKDGSFQELQCFDTNGPDDCMCVYKDGTLLSLPHQGLNTTTCLCYMIKYERLLKKFITEEDYRGPICDYSGYFNHKQCSVESRKCWCVTKYGIEVVPPSPYRTTCDDVAHLL